MNLLRVIQGATQPQADLKRVYDAIVIGSGAAGGMAAHVLTSHGMNVLIGIRQELEYRGNVYLAEFSGEDVSVNR